MCYFMARIGTRQNGDRRGVYFEVGSYTYGHAPDQMALDFTVAEPAITTERVQAGGETREIVTICRCVALGETLIIENVRGSGGVLAVQKLLSKLLPLYCTFGPSGRRYPTLELVDVASAALRDEIIRGRGVAKVTLRMINATPPEPDGWLQPLRMGRARVRDAARFTATWEAADSKQLSTDDVLSAVDEQMEEDSDLDKVLIELVDGNRIDSLGKYKARHEVVVPVDNANVMHASVLIDGMWGYLDDLRRTHNNWRLVDDDGYFTTGSAVEVV